MTGYGKGSAGSKKFSAEAEIKSVNSRFFEVFLKLPPALSEFDFELREMIKSKVKRGKVNVSIALRKNGHENGSISVDLEKLKNHVALLNKIRITAKVKDNIRLQDILINKDIFASDYSIISLADLSVVKRALNKALSDLNKMKKNEGASLSKDIVLRINKIKKIVASIEQKFRRSINDHFIALKQRAAGLINNAEMDADRLNLELALLADRADITEECVRLKSHLKLFTASLKDEAEPGRKLNFLCQEINREANTISSKSVSTAIIHLAIQIKEEAEKIREQIQNIE
jgi:uncharacterized protein (TIGR00255 family)